MIVWGVCVRVCAIIQFQLYKLNKVRSNAQHGDHGYQYCVVNLKFAESRS